MAICKKGYTYDEFGSIEENGNTSFLNEVTFTGSVTDKSTGLQYMNARFYDSATGRFISQDTYSGNPYDPWTHHLYVYCGNNPTNMVDPTGHKSEWKSNADYAQYYFKSANQYDKIVTSYRQVYKKYNQQHPLDRNSNSAYVKMVLDEKERLLDELNFNIRMREYYNEKYWSYKEKAANAKDVDQLRKRTEAPVAKVLEDNKKEIQQNGMSIFSFYNAVKSEGPWDYKVEDIRKGNKHLLGIFDEPYIYVDNLVMTWEEFGNYHYGYVGAVVGYTKPIFILGSVYAHGAAIDNNERIDHEWISMGIKAIRN